MDCIGHGIPQSWWQLFKIYPSPTYSLLCLRIYSHQSLLSLSLHSIFTDVPPLVLAAGALYLFSLVVLFCLEATHYSLLEEQGEQFENEGGVL